VFLANGIGRRAATELRRIGYEVSASDEAVLISRAAPDQLREWHANREAFLVRAEALTGRSWDSAARNDRQSSERHKKAETAEETIARLRAAGRVVIAQREEWKARALAAEKELAARAADDRPRTATGRYVKLKRAIAQVLHPDGHPAGPDRAVREELFKALWRRVEEIDGTA